MVVPSFTKCTTCTKQYKVRYGMGDDFPQEASFHCEKCGELLVIGYDKSHSPFFKNMDEIQQPIDYTVRNVHPELTMEAGFENDPYYFPTINFVMAQVGQDVQGLPILRAVQKSVRDYENSWSEVKLNFRYLKEERWSMLEHLYGKNKERAISKILKEILKVGRFFMVGKWEQIYKDVYSQVEEARKLPGFVDFKNYLITRRTELLIDKAYDLMKDYENAKNELKSTLVAQKCNQPVSGKSSNADWEKLVKVYGDFLEFYGELLCIPTGINNIIARGDYRLFNDAKFNYSKYLVSDKAHRADNLKTNPRMIALSEHFEAYIRNGTHHKNAQIDKDKQEINLSVGKGGVDTEILTLTEYIEVCNELYARALILLNMHYKIIS